MSDKTNTCGTCKRFGNPFDFHCGDVYPEPDDPACEAYEKNES